MKYTTYHESHENTWYDQKPMNSSHFSLKNTAQILQVQMN